MKKIIIFFLTAISIVCLNVFVYAEVDSSHSISSMEFDLGQNEIKSDDIVNFLYDKGFICYDIISIEKTSNSTVLHQDNSNDRYIEFSCSSNYINANFYENGNFDNVKFMQDGSVYINDRLTRLDYNSITPLSYASTNYVGAMPNHYQYTGFSYFGYVNGIDVVLSQIIKDMTSSVLAVSIATAIGIPGANAPLLSTLAVSCIQTAVSGNINARALKFYANVDIANSIPVGLENVYRYTPSAKINGYNSHISGTIYYKVETLI